MRLVIFYVSWLLSLTESVKLLCVFVTVGLIRRSVFTLHLSSLESEREKRVAHLESPDNQLTLQVKLFFCPISFMTSDSSYVTFQER